MNTDILISAADFNGKFAGVFQYDGIVGYFYLYEIDVEILDHIRIPEDLRGVCEGDCRIEWSADQAEVTLFLRDAKYAQFDVSSGRKWARRRRAS